MKMAAMCGLLALGMTGTGWAQPAAPAAEAAGNLPAGFYVRSSCLKPEKPVGKPAYTDPQDVAIYNLRVQRFNKAVAAFNVCLKAYLENADRDVERILSVVNSAVAEVQGSAPPPAPVAPGNMPADFYPASPCAKPSREALGTQPPPQDVKAMAAYNLRVASFNDQAKVFADCLRGYQDNARRDMEQIRAATRDAATDAGAP